MWEGTAAASVDGERGARRPGGCRCLLFPPGAEIVALPGRSEDGVIGTADVFTTREGRLVRADGYPPHPDRFAAAGIDLPGLLGDRRP